MRKHQNEEPLEGGVYIVKNKALPGMLKIGMADDIKKRLITLSNSSLPYPFEVVCFVKFDNCAGAEHEIHNKLKEYRVVENREFFSCSEELAKEVLTNLNADEFTDEANSKKPKLKFRRVLVSELRKEKAPRILTVKSIMEYSKKQMGMNVPKITAQTSLIRLTNDKILTSPRRGLYLNTLAEPQPTIAELAPHLRDGAVISLQTVLGQAGVLNNPTPWVTCVVPRSRTTNTGKMDVDGTVFSFSSMNEAAMCEDLPHLALQPYAQTPTATPEKALLDWIYLAKHSRKWSEPPRFDLDLDRLDHDAMETLSKAMGIEAEWVEFRDRTAPVPTTPKTPFRRPR